jgi:prepilin-type processing-associated H-X9-DG protein
MYADDNNGFLPASANPNDSSGTGGLKFRAAIDPYVKTTEIWFCPSDIHANKKTSAPFVGCGNSQAPPFNADCGVNHKLMSYFFNWRLWAPDAHSKPPYAMDKSHLIDVAGQGTFSYAPADLYLTMDGKRGQGSGPNPPFPPQAHSGGWDMLFMDGHVKWIETAYSAKR